MPSGTESPHVQVDETDHYEGKGCGGQACAPVVDPEILKQKHCPPIVEGGLFQPRMAIEIGGDTGA